MSHIAAIRSYLLLLQYSLCTILEQLDGQQVFVDDPWQSHENYGITRVLSGGDVFSKAAVNYSHMHGNSLPCSASQRHADIAGRPFAVLGVSVVIHPRNPFVPTAHLNVRYFQVKTDNNLVWWFGGGFDLTPCYGFTEDCVHWHTVARDACGCLDGNTTYRQMKQQCDDYFWNVHRNEPRGVGGIFFDDLNAPDFASCFEFMQAVGNNFERGYAPIVHRRQQHPFTDADVAFQQIRRGRYVEFNLVYDRGTLFGLQSTGRIESILVSMPDHASWEYQHQPTTAAQRELTDYFLQNRDWLAEHVLQP